MRLVRSADDDPGDAMIQWAVVVAAQVRVGHSPCQLRL